MAVRAVAATLALLVAGCGEPKLYPGEVVGHGYRPARTDTVCYPDPLSKEPRLRCTDAHVPEEWLIEVAQLPAEKAAREAPDEIEYVVFSFATEGARNRWPIGARCVVVRGPLGKEIRPPVKAER